MPTLTSASDLITAIPFLLGFHPNNSIVAIAVKDGAIGMTLRIDLPDHLTHGAIDQLVGHFQREEADACLLVAYLPDNRADGDELLIALGAGFMRAAIEIQESVVVANGRYRSIICRDEECCPSMGNSLPELESSAMAAEHVVAGVPMPFHDINHLAESIAADPSFNSDRWRAQVATFAIEEESQEIAALRRDGVEAMELLLDDYRMGYGVRNHTLVARLIGRVAEVQVRDYALGIHNEENYDLYFALWRDLIRMAPEGYVAPIACILAAMAYENGDGALAQRALDRAFLDDEMYPLAGLLRRVFNAGWPPESFAAMRAELHPKVVATIFQ